jgi:hypothetical protein
VDGTLQTVGCLAVAALTDLDGRSHAPSALEPFSINTTRRRENNMRKILLMLTAFGVPAATTLVPHVNHTPLTNLVAGWEEGVTRA